MARYLIGFILAVGLIILVIVLIIHALTGTHKGPVALDLPSYAQSDVKVQLTIDTPITAPTTHNDVILTVGDVQSTLIVAQGYDNSIVSMKNYPMTSTAYGVFLRALSLNGFTLQNPNPALADERGHCAQGDRYIYEVIDGNGNDLQRDWYSSCGMGNFTGKEDVIRQLFIQQFPDYSDQTANVNF